MLESKILKLSQLLSHSASGFLFVDLKSRNVLYCHDDLKDLLETNHTLPFSIDLIIDQSNDLFSYIKEIQNGSYPTSVSFKKNKEEKILGNVRFSSLQEFFEETTEIYVLYLDWKTKSESNSFKQTDEFEIPFLKTDSFGNILYANPRFLDFFSLNIDQIRKKSIFEILSLSDETKQNLLKENIKENLEIQSGFGEKQKFQLQSFITNQGNPTNQEITILLLDLSIIQNAEQTIKYGEDKLRTFFATINNGFVIVNQEAIILEVAPIFKFYYSSY